MQAGDKVYLSGSCYENDTPLWPMTVVSVSELSGAVTCAWHIHSGELHQTVLPLAALTKMN